MCGKIVTGIWFAAALVLPAAARDKVPAPEPPSVETLQAMMGTRWLGIYIQGKKCGHGSLRLEKIAKDGEELYQSAMELNLLAVVGGQKSQSRSRILQSFSTQPPFPLMAFEVSSLQGDREQSTRGRVKGDELEVVASSGGQETTRRIPRPSATFAGQFGSNLFARSQPAVGAWTEFPLFLPSRQEEDLVRVEVAEVEHLPAAGVEVEVRTMHERSEHTGVDLISTYDTHGFPLEARFGNYLTIRIEEEALAKDHGYSDDILLGGRIPVDRALGHPARVRRMVLDVKGLAVRNAITDGRQVFEPQSDGGALVRIGTERQPESSAEVPETEEIRKALRPEAWIESDHEKIRAQAGSIVSGETDSWKKALRIVRWVHVNVAPEYALGAISALEVLRTRKGDCTEYTRLFVALARAAGIPAREVGGIAYAGDRLRAFGYHAWPEVWIGRWIAVDPTWGEEVVDATHVKLFDADDRGSILNLIGRMELHVVELDVDPPPASPSPK